MHSSYLSSKLVVVFGLRWKYGMQCNKDHEFSSVEHGVGALIELEHGDHSCPAWEKYSGYMCLMKILRLFL